MFAEMVIEQATPLRLVVLLGAVCFLLFLASTVVVVLLLVWNIARRGGRNLLPCPDCGRAVSRRARRYRRPVPAAE